MAGEELARGWGCRGKISHRRRDEAENAGNTHVKIVEWGGHSATTYSQIRTGNLHTELVNQISPSYRF